MIYSGCLGYYDGCTCNRCKVAEQKAREREKENHKMSIGHGFGNGATHMISPKVRYFSRFQWIFKTGKPGDVGYDLFVEVTDQTWYDRLVSWWTGRKVMVILPFHVRELRSGIHLDLPESLWVYIVERSSTLRKRMMVLGGVIDSGYRGELFTPILNFGFIPRIIRGGERYAQAIFIPAVRPSTDWVNFESELSQSARGATGFGSTGR